MNCLEAQRLMHAYTEGKLPDKVTEEFLDHIESCRECHEELELYLMVHNVLDDVPSPAGAKQAGIDEQIRMTRNAIGRRKVRKVTLSFLAMVFAILLSLFLHMGLDIHHQFWRKNRPRKVKKAVTAVMTETPGEAVTEMITEAPGEAVTEMITEVPGEPVNELITEEPGTDPER